MYLHLFPITLGQGLKGRANGDVKNVIWLDFPLFICKQSGILGIFRSAETITVTND